MSTAVEHRTVHDIQIAAPAAVVYEIIADATHWPVYFPPTVHVLRTELDEWTERLQLWATGAGVVRAWSSIRTLDADQRCISFHREFSVPPVKSMLGKWLIEPRGDAAVRLVLIHDFEAVDDDPANIAWITRATDENSLAEMGNIKKLAESWDTIGERELAFDDVVRVRGSAEHVYEFLHDCGAWPDRLPHVAELDLREEDDGALQLMSMWSLAKDGSRHLTVSARVCFPAERIVYKQTLTPEMIDAHAGEWTVEPAGDDVLVRSRHRVLLSERALGFVPAAGDTWASTRDFVERSIKGNSAVTLAHAKAYAEQRA
ncbi:aromatase/cyclase [Microlunatus ginsengisoli]|uniref:Coenzyme Q-binding protein COQ10 START domain-containing protein n=1 Tax=Microlunatus ginsengisoli TaxID=363863 RepID=A0ABP7AHH8_9ACTN